MDLRDIKAAYRTRHRGPSLRPGNAVIMKAVAMTGAGSEARAVRSVDRGGGTDTRAGELRTEQGRATCQGMGERSCVVCLKERTPLPERREASPRSRCRLGVGRPWELGCGDLTRAQ